MMAFILGNPLKMIGGALALAAALWVGSLYLRYQSALDANMALEARVSSLTLSIEVAQRQTMQVRAAWAAGQEAIEVLRVRSKELDQIKSDLLKGNYNALDLDPALRDTLCWLLRNRAARGATGSANGSPAAPVATCNQTRP